VLFAPDKCENATGPVVACRWRLRMRLPTMSVVNSLARVLSPSNAPVKALHQLQLVVPQIFPDLAAEHPIGPG
jgi:hypothetical protein